MITKPDSTFSPFCSCGGRRDFLYKGFLASTSLLLSRALLQAAASMGSDPTSYEVSANRITNAIPYAAQPLPLNVVRLTGGPLKHAQELVAANLLEIDTDRILYRLRERAGLKPKAANGYGSWEGPGRQLTGAMAGHYLSGLSYMYAATGDQKFNDRVRYVVSELKEIQDKQGDGYIGALMGTLPANQEIVDDKVTLGDQSFPIFKFPTNRGRGGAPQFDNVVDGKYCFQQITQGTIRSSGFDLNGMWSPWYVQHKLFAGLRDAYRQTGNHVALVIAVKFAGWVESIVGSLTDAQTQKMLTTEFGGMNESLADLYADTGDQRWLALSTKFHHQAIVNPLANHRDILGGKHGNTTIPKMIGEHARYIYSGDTSPGEAAKYFWDAVVSHHSFATGGHGYDESFDAPDKLSGAVDGTIRDVVQADSTIRRGNHDLRSCESCNVYNMVKLTRMLFAVAPNIQFAEFHERALFNHVLASIDFKSGQVSYMVPIGQGVTHEYQGDLGMTCCAGTGLENHGLHADGLYFSSSDKLWVNIYAPSTARWGEQSVDFAMETNFPEGESATLKIISSFSRESTIALRRPLWAGEGFSVHVNGEAVPNLSPAGSYIEVKRTWKAGDSIAINLPKSLRKEALPDNPNRVALMWGPLVLGADLGDSGLRGRYPLNPPVEYPSFIAQVDAPVSQWLKPSGDKPGAFHATGVGGANNEVDFLPFYQLSQRRYGIYWDVYTPKEWAQHNDPDAARRMKLDAATVAFLQPGQMQPERDYNFQGEDSTIIAGDTPGRWGTKWFSFDLPVDSAHPMVVLITYNSGDPTTRTFDISADGTKLKTETVATALPAKLYDVEYAIPAEIVKGKQKVTIRFDAANSSGIAGVYGVRMIRGDAAR